MGRGEAKEKWNHQKLQTVPLANDGMLNLIGCAPLEKTVYVLIKTSILEVPNNLASFLNYNMYQKKDSCNILSRRYFLSIICIGCAACGDKNFLGIDHLVLNQCYTHAHICKIDKMLQSSLLSLNQFQTHIFISFLILIWNTMKKSPLCSGKNKAVRSPWVLSSV